jgi:Protein of unknown function (DUF2949)
MKSNQVAQFMRFLQDELHIPSASLQKALNHPEQTPSLLPMILWQDGLVTLRQLERMFDWMEGHLA